ncbi:hypothetical protein Tco_1237533 [Tanacetum coccineum]
MTKLNSFNRSPKHRALYHDLMEAILKDEDAMDKGVAYKLKKRKPDDAGKDEDPSARSNRGLKRQRTSKGTETSKNISTSKDSSKVKSPSTSSKSGKSVKYQVEEPIFVQDSDDVEHDDTEFDNVDMPMDQGEYLSKTDEQPIDEANQLMIGQNKISSMIWPKKQNLVGNKRILSAVEVNAASYDLLPVQNVTTARRVSAVILNYALWDVIDNGNSFKPSAKTTTNVDGTSTTLISGPVTTEEKYKDSKTLFAAIQTRFGGNEATKKTQKTLLKQMYENFKDFNLKFLRSPPSEWNTHVVVWRNKPNLDTMSFDDLYNNVKIVEQEVKGTASSNSSSSSQNMVFVSSPSSTNEVNTAHEVSPAITQVSTASTQVSMANLSDDTIYAFLASQPNGSQLVYEDLKQIHEDDIEDMDLKWQLALLSMRTRSSRRTVNVEEISSKAMLAIDGAGFDWSYMADDEVPTNMALMDFSTLSVFKGELEKLKQEKESNQLKIENFDNASKSLDKLIGNQIPDKSRKGLGFVSYNVVPPPPTRLFSPPKLDLSNSCLEEFQHPEFKGYGPKTSKNVCEDTSNKFRESPDVLMVEKLVSDD